MSRRIEQLEANQSETHAMRAILVEEEIGKRGPSLEKGREEIPLIPVKDVDRVVVYKPEEFVSESHDNRDDRQYGAAGHHCLLPIQQSKFYKLFAPLSVLNCNEPILV
jgi:hypothetical protein